MAGDSVTPGMGKKPVGLERRISALERITNGMSKQRLIADTAIGRKEFQVLGMRGGPKPETPPGIHPFRLEKMEDGWKVNAWGSTITDGTNGDALTITGLDEKKTEEGDVFVEVSINASLETTASEIKSETGGYAGEVEFAGDPPAQNKAFLLIGKTVKEDGVFKFAQAITDAQILTHGLLNGAAVRVFIPGPIHPTFLELPVEP